MRFRAIQVWRSRFWRLEPPESSGRPCLNEKCRYIGALRDAAPRTRPCSQSRRLCVPETHHRAASWQLEGGDCIFEVDSPPDLAHHCGVDHGLSLCSAPRQGAARRAAGLVQSRAAARRATALDDSRIYPAGRPRPPRWTFSPLCAPLSAHVGTGGQKKPNTSRQVISQPGGQRPQLRGLPRSGKAHVILLIAMSSSTWS